MQSTLSYLVRPTIRPDGDQVDPGLSVQQFDGLHAELYGGAVLHHTDVQPDVGGPEVEIALVTGPACAVKYEASVHHGDLNHRHHLVTGRDIILEPGQVNFSTICLDIQVCQRVSRGIIRAVTIGGELLWVNRNILYLWLVIRHWILV